MKNPFPSGVEARKCPVGLYWEVWLVNDRCLTSVLTEEQAKYIAHVLMQHDKLVEMVKNLQHQGRDVDDWPICPVCLQRDDESHTIDCELTALLEAEDAL